MATILIADDDLLIRKAYIDIFEDQGYTVEVHENGISAVDSCAVNMPDVIILDIHMPEINGIEACKRIRELPGGKNVPILMISGSMGRDELDVIKSGADKLLRKPFEIKNLLSTIKQYLT
ncbi:MAG: response regulator [Victivallales bacterium]|nr:response regulator [Victivallales bacterium]